MNEGTLGAGSDATGLGEENRTVTAAIASGVPTPLFEGQAFWSPDRLNALSASDEVLISGSGDGALQDYLRVVTGLDSVSGILSRITLPNGLGGALQSAEDRAYRGRSWASDARSSITKAHEQPFMVELHKAHMDAVGLALSDPGLRIQLDALLFQRGNLRVLRLVLVHRDDYLTCYYGLNRFLVLLVSEFLSKNKGIVTRYPHFEIDSIASSNGHTCMASVGGMQRAAGLYARGVLIRPNCFRQLHTVTFKVTHGLSAPVPDYNVVLVRPGINPASKGPFLHAWSRKLSRTRHLMPYYLP